MRLRRESGDFQLTFDMFTNPENPEKTKHIRKNLSSEDLIGLCVTVIAPDDDGRKVVARSVVTGTEWPRYAIDDHDNAVEYCALILSNKASISYYPKDGDIVLEV